MDVDGLRDALEQFGRRHAQALRSFPRRESQLLELAAMTLAAIHYERCGYTVKASNVGSGNEFRMKLTTNGRPENFSWWTVQLGSLTYEIHANLPVISAYGADLGTYVVDVAVIRGGSLARLRSLGPRRRALPNKDLVTFVEAKRLVIYPMLLAQFVGIVHEILPRFLNGRRPRGFRKASHFDPALVSVGYLHGTCRAIVSAYPERRFRLSIVPNCDGEISRLHRDPAAASPLRSRGSR